jgi:hypothetical protein
MKIDIDRHLNYTIQELNYAIDTIENLREEYKDEKAFQDVLEKAIEWYETKNINAYTFFNRAFIRIGENLAL